MATTSTKVYTLGLSKIELGAIASDGGMGTTLAQLGYTYQDTCSLTMEDPEKTEFYAEEVDDPVITISRIGKTTFAFSLMNPSVDTMVTLMGGTANSTDGSWEAPSTQPNIELSCAITPKQGYKFEIPRLSIVAKINGNLSKTGITLIEVTGTVLVPSKDGEPKLTATPIAE